MDNPRTLPPLVRGKLTAVLNFFIDEIIIYRNVFYLTKNVDITAQLRWWGEILPACIRPKILQVQDKISSIKSVETYCYSVQYEIRTTVDLLKSYLEASEVLELSVYEGVENFLIGSAFFKIPCNLLTKNNEFILMPIIDYSGEKIGQIKFHINFVEYAQNNKSHTTHKHETSEVDSDVLEKKMSVLLNSNYVLSGEKTIFYDGYSKATNFEVEANQNSEIDKNSVKSRNNKCNLVLSNYNSEISLENDFKNKAKGPSEYKLPKVYVSKDSSKILNFNLSLNPKKSERNNESKLPNKYSSSLINCKSKSKTEKSSLGISTSNEKFLMKTTLTNKMSKKPESLTDEMDSKTLPKTQSIESFSNKNSSLDNISQTCSNKMIFDYLLGSVMSKENEESALKDFKKMSPSHDIVSSINELCLTSGKVKVCLDKSMKHNLCFDLSNPIERNYYEKFFVRNNSNDFQIAELLNEPENSYALQESKSNVRSVQRDSSKNENISVCETIKKEFDDFSYNADKENKIASGCARCKYYKKLDELDTIIESLKHFEKNMLKQEKSLQLGLEVNLGKQGSKISDR